MPSSYDLHVLDQPVCSMLWLGLTHSFCVVHMYKLYFLCDIQWSEAQSHSDDSHVHANGPYCTRAIA